MLIFQKNMSLLCDKLKITESFIEVHAGSLMHEPVNELPIASENTARTCQCIEDHPKKSTHVSKSLSTLVTFSVTCK